MGHYPFMDSIMYPRRLKLKHTWKAITGVLVLTFLLVAPAWADLTIVSEITDNQGTRTSTTYITKDRVRTTDGDTDTIFEVDTGRMIQIEHKKKKYFVTSLEEIRAKMEEFEKMIEENPMVGQMLGDLTAGAEVRKLDGTRSIAGYPCQEYELQLGKNMTMVLWVTSDLDSPTSYHDAQKMVYATMGPMAKRFETLLDEMKKINGMSLASNLEAKFMGRGMTVRQEAVSVSEDPISADTFAIPSGYKQKKAPF